VQREIRQTPPAISNRRFSGVLKIARKIRKEFLHRIRTDGTIKDFETDYLLKGVSVPYLVSGAIVDTADGPIIFGISREIASHKRMEQEVIAAREAALAASQAKSEFLSSAYRKPHPGRCAEARVLEAHQKALPVARIVLDSCG
jgi:hypothetical protein